MYFYVLTKVNMKPPKITANPLPPLLTRHQNHRHQGHRNPQQPSAAFSIIENSSLSCSSLKSSSKYFIVPCVTQITSLFYPIRYRNVYSQTMALEWRTHTHYGPCRAVDSSLHAVYTGLGEWLPAWLFFKRIYFVVVHVKFIPSFLIQLVNNVSARSITGLRRLDSTPLPPTSDVALNNPLWALKTSIAFLRWSPLNE